MLKFCKYQSEFISSSAITLYTAILARDLDSVEIWNDMDSIDYLMYVKLTLFLYEMILVRINTGSCSIDYWNLMILFLLSTFCS